MIARHETHNGADIWSALAAPLPPGAIQWRQDGRPISRDGKHLARFVGYIDAHFVHDRLDSAVPGEWDSTLELLPPAVTTDGEEVEPFAFKCRIQILGVIREDVGTGKDYKSAASDALKRTAVRFGIGKELYALEANWVQMDGDGKYAKPLEDPGVAYARRYGGSANARPTTGNGSPSRSAPASSESASPIPISSGSASNSTPSASTPDIGPKTSEVPNCPDCGGPCWDNRPTKKGNQPDFKCKDRSCGKAVWLEKKGARKPEPEYEEEIPF